MLPTDAQRTILDLIDSGESQREAARIAGVSRAAVASVVKRGCVLFAADRNLTTESESPKMFSFRKLPGCRSCKGPGGQDRRTCVECLARAALQAKLPRVPDHDDDEGWLVLQVDNLPPRVLRE